MSFFICFSSAIWTRSEYWEWPPRPSFHSLCCRLRMIPPKTVMYMDSIADPEVAVTQIVTWAINSGCTSAMPAYLFNPITQNLWTCGARQGRKGSRSPQKVNSTWQDGSLHRIGMPWTYGGGNWQSWYQAYNPTETVVEQVFYLTSDWDCGTKINGRFICRWLVEGRCLVEDDAT